MPYTNKFTKNPLIRTEYSKYYISTPNNGKKAKMCVSLIIFLRDYLNVCVNTKEVKKIITSGIVSLNGKIIKDKKYPVYFFEPIKVKDKCFRLLISPKKFIIKEFTTFNNFLKVKEFSYYNKKNKEKGEKYIILRFFNNTNKIICERDFNSYNIKKNQTVMTNEVMKIITVFTFKVDNKAYCFKGKYKGRVFTIKKELDDTVETYKGIKLLKTQIICYDSEVDINNELRNFEDI